MALKTGFWKINIFGMEADLTIAETIEGRVHGRIDNYPFRELNGSISGLFNETSQEILFGIAIDPSLYTTPSLAAEASIAPMQGLVFRGCLFASPKNRQLGQDITWNLVGTLEVTNPEILQMVFQSNSRRTTFGWMAQITDAQ